MSTTAGWSASPPRAPRAGHGMPGRARKVLADIALACVLLGGLWLTRAPTPPIGRGPQLILVLIVGVAFVLRRRAPRIATCAVLLATAAGWWLGVTRDPFLIAGLCLMVVAERTGTRRYPWWLLIPAALLLAFLLFAAADGQDGYIGTAVYATVVLGASWALGVAVRQSREETARRVQSEERLRLTRDVHDTLTHTLGGIGVRAGVLAHVESTSREDLRSALRAVEEDSRSALVELRSLLQRERDGAGQPPAATLDALIADVARRAEAAGVRTTITIDPAALTASVSVRTTVHRIIQEAVTNVIRHARASTCEITVHAEQGRLIVRVQDDGRGASTAVPAGYGLVGMRERIALLGGALETGDAPGGGFRVLATLPLEPRPETTP